MSHSSDLLAQAKRLLENEPRRPKQASLRRAISAAYYALFHHLVSEAALFMVKGAGATLIRPIFQRAFVHNQMKVAAKSFSGGTLPDHWQGTMDGAPISAELRQIAATFVDLQEARHRADYDFSVQFSRENARDLIERSEKAIIAWHTIRNTTEAHVFLTALLVNERVSRF